ncbi:ATP-dependent helicase [Endozoicomonas sp. GU-1]|uniref:UvrD-helicase domain-containing protein n=1 Tax=Endozoicomonas sp. GU-1 TaxID=3009078 RepID=UPI0022B5997C|nr:ATP-dependent helicase [Endozoicomonas sp. GU-1]WBA82372.1 ATP-dependent helicase [Endozoicomonas sp. GU-1]WBA85309.1 ATP-dependent helicase [Endozoicomonas sp. GU-1]
MSDLTFTEEQLEAIEHDGNMVITACPGSGKTTVVVEKIRRIVPELKSYQGVIGITFTVKASEELKKRCKKNAFDTRQSFFGTIDSFCLKEIIFPFASHLWGRAECEVKPVLKMSDEEKADFGGWDWATEHFQDYENILKQWYHSGKIPMAATGALACHILDHSPACTRYITARYKTVFIDEYQDSSQPQHELFLKLVSLGLTGIAVGDEDQAIYGFRDGNKEFIRRLIDSNDFETFPILINHRCHPSISNYARRVIRPECELAPADDLRVYRASRRGTVIDLGRTISESIPNIKERLDITHNSDIAILVRAKRSLRKVAEGMTVLHRVHEDDPLSDIGDEHAKLCINLLHYRFDKQLTAEGVISENLMEVSSKAKSTSLRQLIKNVRSCEDEELCSAIHSVTTEMFPGPISRSVADTLQVVLGNPELLAKFYPVNKDEVQIMTLHKAKGLEFDVVFHLDLYEWSFPLKRPQDGWNTPAVYVDLEEDKNLHYVGITRARKACYLLTSLQRFNSRDEVKGGSPSEFFDLPGLEGLYEQK